MRTKRHLVSSSLIGRRGLSCWLKIAGTNSELGVSFGPNGMIEVGRMFYSAGWQPGTVRFEADGRYWYWTFEPCPSRLGLVRIARRLRRRVEDLHDAECMFRANGSFASKARREAMAEGVRALRRKLGLPLGADR